MMSPAPTWMASLDSATPRSRGRRSCVRARGLVTVVGAVDPLGRRTVGDVIARGSERTRRPGMIATDQHPPVADATNNQTPTGASPACQSWSARRFEPRVEDRVGVSAYLRQQTDRAQFPAESAPLSLRRRDWH
jgi:hypothetical protein